MSAQQICPNCGGPVRANAQFCGHCGAAMAQQGAGSDQSPGYNQTPPYNQGPAHNQTPSYTQGPPYGAENAQIYGAAVAAPAGAGPATPDVALKRSRRLAIIIPGVVVLLLLIGGAAAAFTVPAFAVNADKSLGDMLPATTVFYVSANLNPSGPTKNNLDRIERVYTSQPAWNNVASAYKSGTQNNSSSSSQCYRQTTGQISDHLGDLGQDTALVMTDTRGINVSNGSSSQTVDAFKRNFAVLAPLHAKRTLVQALSGFDISLAHKEGNYSGTDIYKETFQACGQADAGTANTVYAAMVKHWVVLGLVPQAIYPIVDTANGQRATLASTGPYRALMTKLASDHLGSYYLNGKSLSKMGVLDAIKSNASASRLPSSTFTRTETQSAGALSVDSHGFNLTFATYDRSGAAYTGQAAGAVTSLVPSDALALLSVQGLSKNIVSAVKQYEQTGLVNASVKKTLNPVLTDLTTDLSGEADLVLFRPTKTMSPNDPSSIPLALMWQENNDISAQQHLNDAVSRLGLSAQLKSGTAPDGTTFRATTQGIGYAIRKGWTIVGLSIPGTLSTLASKPAQSVANIDAYQRGIPRNVVPASTYYFDGQRLRKALEDALLPTQSQAVQSQYHSYVVPFIAPIQHISGSTGTTKDGKFNVSTLILDIGS